MKKNSSKAKDNKRSQINKQLHRRLESIEREWDTYIKRGKPRSKSKSLLKRSLTNSALHDDQILAVSPRILMSSSQDCRRESPASSGMIWKVRNNDIAFLEIQREREADLASGKFKGRRLFVGSSSSKDGGDIRSELCFDHELCPQEYCCEVRSLRSYGSDDDEDEKRYCLDEYYGSDYDIGGVSSTDHEKGCCLNSSLSPEEKIGKNYLSLRDEGDQKVERNHDHVKETRNVRIFGAKFEGKNGGRLWMLAMSMACFAVVTLMAVTLGRLISIRCSGGSNIIEEEIKAFLIPT